MKSHEIYERLKTAGEVKRIAKMAKTSTAGMRYWFENPHLIDKKRAKKLAAAVNTVAGDLRALSAEIEKIGAA